MRTLLCAMGAVLTISGAVQAEALSPVNVPELRAQILASKPTGPVVLRIRNKARIHFSQGDSVVVFTKAGNSSPRIKTMITEMSGNRFCVAAAKSWAGMCVEMFKGPDNGYTCRGEYGNGYGFDARDCWIKIPR